MQKQPQPIYLIKSSLIDGQIFIDLDILDPKTGDKIIRCFSSSFNDDSLPEMVKKNFKDINNVDSILNNNPGICKVDTDKGVLTLVYQVTFPNGTKFQLQGSLQLKQKQLPVQKNQLTKKSSSFMINQQMDNKIKKLEQDVKKIQQYCQQDTKSRQNLINKVVKDIAQDIQLLKDKYQEIKHWKKDQQKKYKQLELQHKNKVHHNVGGSSKQFKLSDQVMHVFNQKLDEQKQFFAQKFQKQGQKIQDMKQSITRHQKYIQKITQQNVQLKKTVKTLEDKSTKIIQKGQDHAQKLQQLLESHKSAIKVINSQQQQIQKVKTQVNSPKKQQKQSPQSHHNDPLIALFQNLQQANMKKSQSSSSSQNLNQSMQSPKNKDILSVSQHIQIHPQSTYSKQFINNGKLLTYNGISQQPTQILSKTPLSKTKSMTLTISKSKSNQISFGLIDPKHLPQRNSIKSANSITYSAHNGTLIDGGTIISTDGTGYRQGDKVKMRVDVSTGLLQWSIGGIVVCKCKSQRIKGAGAWLGVVRMCERGDAVKWTVQ